MPRYFLWRCIVAASMGKSSRKARLALKNGKLEIRLIRLQKLFGICWSSDTNSDVLDYARQMGHTHVVYRSGMEKLPQANGMSFFIEDPEFGARLRMMDYDKKYSQKEIDDIQSHYVVIYHDKEFPYNMASSWFIPPNQRSLTLDFQQQKVIDDIVGRMMARIKRINKVNPDFSFAGLRGTSPIRAEIFVCRQSRK